uniref:Peptidase S1 domain-containing protein n=1 Tax=Plectus sambesii TaxID=2011161 RepID=A0A914VIN5_9BILA
MAEQGELEQEIVDMFEELNFEKLMLEFFELLAELRDIDPRFVVELLRMDWREELSNMVKNTSINKKLLEFVKCISIDADTGIISIKQEPNCPVNKYKLSERLFPALYDMTCDLYGAWETCASECPELDSNRRVHDILPYVEGFHFVCNSLGKDFLSYFPCFDRCDKQCTAPLTYLSTMNIPRKFDTQTGGLTFAYQAALKRLCSAYSCLLQCQTSHALKNCPGEKGQIAATILETIAEKTLGGLLKLFKTHYPNVVFAKECEKFAEQSDPVITMNKIIIDADPGDWRVIAGNAQPNETDTTTMTRMIAEFITHPNYKFRTMVASNDVMLVRLQKELPLNKARLNGLLGAICLPPRETDDQNTFCVTAGWGYTNPGGYYINKQLRHLEMSVWKSAECNSSDHYSGLIDPTILCASSKEQEWGPCFNDEGSPLMCHDAVSGRWYLAGILTTHRCGSRNHPAIFADIFAVKEWISHLVFRSAQRLHETTE